MVGWMLCNSFFPKSKKILNLDLWYLYNHNNKYVDDKIIIDNSEIFILLDGVVFNKKILLNDCPMMQWSDYFKQRILTDKYEFIKQLRGTFNGIILNKKENTFEVFVDQLGERPVFYYNEKEAIMVGTNLNHIVDHLKYNKIKYTPDLEATKRFLNYGFMVDNSTHIKEIKKIFPGNYLEITNSKEFSYFKFDNKKCLHCSNDMYIEMIDKAFRNAIGIELDKEEEYGYDILMDISGGMDARTNAYVAHSMGYRNVTNIAYSQGNAYERKISEKIANSLGNDYMFKSLDNASFVFDVDEITNQNYGLTFYLGTTGAPRCLKSLNPNKFGMEHTGLLGDIYEGSFNEKANYSKPHVEKKYFFSKFADLKMNEDFLNLYTDQELFSFYTRGVLGGVGTHMIRQNYFDTYSPFADVDFLELMFAIPQETRINNKIYIKWLEKCYPMALEHPYARTMCKVNTNIHIANIKKNSIRVKDKLILPVVKKLGFNIETNSRLTMNPTEYWVKTNPKINNFVNNYFEDNRKYVPEDKELVSYLERVQSNGTLIDKSLALTMLSTYKHYFSD